MTAIKEEKQSIFDFAGEGKVDWFFKKQIKHGKMRRGYFGRGTAHRICCGILLAEKKILVI
jgi:hypothetical protein